MLSLKFERPRHDRHGRAGRIRRRGTRRVHGEASGRLLEVALTRAAFPVTAFDLTRGMDLQ